MTPRARFFAALPLVLAALAALVPGAARAQFNHETKLTASDAAAGDWFGYSVSISGDSALVGAVGNADAGRDSGSAYIFQRNQGGANAWGEVAKLTASDAALADLFGESVSLSGDLALVGAAGNAGSAYIYQRSQGGANAWGEVLKLTASDAAAGDNFGISVSIWGDLAIVGADGNADAGQQSGSAYIFERNQGGANAWGELTKLTASDAAAGDWFGYSVSIWGDLAIVGAFRNADAGRDSGSAYIFQRNQGGANAWGEVAKLTASDAALGDHFGRSVGIWGDLAIVGAYGKDDAGRNSGSAYIYQRGQGGANAWGELAKLTASGAAPGDQFGFSVGISGDSSLVGAYLDADAGRESGSAYIFQQKQGGANAWGELVKMTASDGATRRAVPLIKAAGGGSIVNISSVAGRFGYPLRTPYAASKWALIGFTKSSAMELGPHGVRVNALLPGFVNNERTRAIFTAKAEATGVTTDELEREILSRVSLRQYVTSEDIAKMAVFLCSDAGRHISGQAISVCGNVESMC